MTRATVTLALISSAAAFAQKAAPLEFEVASIKPAGPLDPVAISQGKVRLGMKVEHLFCAPV